MGDHNVAVIEYGGQALEKWRPRRSDSSLSRPQTSATFYRPNDCEAQCPSQYRNVTSTRRRAGHEWSLRYRPTKIYARTSNWQKRHHIANQGALARARNQAEEPEFLTENPIY